MNEDKIILIINIMDVYKFVIGYISIIKFNYVKRILSYIS